MKQREPENLFSIEERDALRAPMPEPADVFWSRFAARAESMTPSEKAPPEPRIIPLISPRQWALGLAAACIFLLTGATVLWTLRPDSGTIGSSIEFLSIDAAHDGVFIMEDAGSPALVVWINERRS